MNVGILSTTAPDLDWEGFLAAQVPGSRRHDLKAITAYAAYKRSRVVDEQSATEPARLKDAERISTEATSVEAWEDEGGAAQ
jgi:hypothetical protein